jgi:hypothetical protein
MRSLPLKGLGAQKMESFEDLDPDFKEGEFYKLKFKSHTKPYYFRIARMKLSPAKRDCLSYTVNKFSDLAQEGYLWKHRGDLLYTLQILSSSLVPVLIGIIGSFKNDGLDNAVRFVAIVLSIMGTMSIAIENVYNYRFRGQTRIHYADQMNSLFQIFDANCGKFKNTVDNANDTLDLYMTEFHELLENARRDSFIGQYKKNEYDPVMTALV